MATAITPSDWHMPMLLTAMVCIVVGCILSLAAMWIDYRSGADPAGPRNMADALVPLAVIGLPAIYLEKNYGFNFWLAAAALALVIWPLWWLYVRARKRKADRITS